MNIKVLEGFQIHKILCCMALAVLGVIVYGNHLHNPFQFDSVAYITNNLNLNNPESMLTLQFWSAGFFDRGLLMISMAYNAYLDGLRPFGYHVFNLSLHIFNAILIFHIFKKALMHFDNPRGQTENTLPISFFAAAIFLVHPIQTESVIYIISRSEIMAASFYLLGFLIFQIFLDLKKCNKLLKFLICPLAIVSLAVVGFSVKQTLATFPLILILYYLSVCPLDSPAIKFILKFKWQMVGVVFIFLGLLFYKLFSDETFLIGPSNPEEMVGRAQYMLSQPGVIVFYYLGKILFPINLNIDPDIEVVSHLYSLRFLSGVAGIVLLFYYSLKQSAWRFYIFFSAWFFIILSPSSSIVTLHDLAAEHRVYLAAPGVILIFSYVAFDFLTKLAGSFEKMKTIYSITFLCSLILLFGILSIQRNNVWQSQLSLWQDTYKKSPDKLRPLINLARAHSIEGHPKEAVRYYEESLSKGPGVFVIHYNLGELYLNDGRVDDAITRFEAALRLKPDIPETYAKLGEIYLAQKRWRKADFYFKKCVEINPGYSHVFKNLGILHFYHLKNLKESLLYFSRSLTLDPNQEEADKIREILVKFNTH